MSLFNVGVQNETNETTDVYDPFSLTNPLEDRIFGVILVMYTICFVGPYITCLWVFATDSEISSRPCYRIIFHIGVSDLIQGITNGIGGGLMSILRIAPYEANRRIGGILEGAWMTYSIFANLLAFNRFVQVCFRNRANKIFSKRRTSVFIAVCWAYGIIAFIIYNTPWVHVIYYPEMYLWGYHTNTESVICGYVEEALDLFQLLCMIIWYIGIFLRLNSQANQMSTNAGRINKKELHVVIQSLLICCLIFATCFGFFVVPQISDYNRYATFLCDLIWLTNCACNPIIYMTFNKTLRRKVFGLVAKHTTARIGATEPSRIEVTVARTKQVQSSIDAVSDHELVSRPVRNGMQHVTHY